MTKRLVKANGRTVRRAAVVGGLVLSLALFLGACENPSGGGGDDGPSAQELAAEEFRAAHGAVLDKTTDTIGWRDDETINAALEAYNALDDDVKDLLTTEKAKLDGLKVRVAEIKRTVFATVESLQTYLAGQADNAADTPYALSYVGSEQPPAIYAALDAGGKFVALDLSESGASEFFGIAETGAQAGMGKIVGLVLPNSLLTIPDTGDSIGGASDYVFSRWFINLKKIRADGVVRIGVGAFSSCTSLEEVDMPNTVSLGSDAFSGCTGLVTVNLPKVTVIETYVFSYCSFTAIDLPAVVTVKQDAFSNCDRLETVNLPNVKTVANQPFRNCTSLKTVNLPSAETIGNSVFTGCGELVTVDLSSATSIGSSAFNGCSKLETIHLPNAASIGSNAFLDCVELETVNLPRVTSLGNGSFTRCTGLVTVILGTMPPTIGTTARIFAGAANTAKTITFKVPDVSTYTTAGSPWLNNDKMGLNVSYYWDNVTATRDNLTVALQAISG
jgi:hypothetical protein